MAIGKPRRVGPIGRPGKRKGWVGKPTTSYGSSLIEDQNRTKAFYPTTTTTTSTTTTTTTTTT